MSSENDEKNSAEVTQPADMKTPEEWSRIQGVQVLDPEDGWRGPISLAEFQERLVGCTQRVSRNHPWCDAPDCTVCDAGERRTGTRYPTDLQPWELVEIAAARMSSVAGIYYIPQTSTDPIYDKLARAALEAAYPAIRQQVAEEIAPVLAEFLGKPAGAMAAEITRRIGRGESL